MKKKDYIISGIFLAIMIAGFIFGRFAGGFLSGLAAALLLFSTIGKILFRRKEKLIDAALRIKAMMKE